MSWQDLLANENETIDVPWAGGSYLFSDGRRFKIKGDLPNEHGWYSFNIDGGRSAYVSNKAEMPMFWEDSRPKVFGYLVGNRLIPDDTSYISSDEDIYDRTIYVNFVEPGLERFSRVLTVFHEQSFYVYIREEFPLGPEHEVREAFQDRKSSISDIKGVTPSLNLAFRFESYIREQREELRRQEEERQRQEEARLREEERLAELRKLIGTGQGRRDLAAVDFRSAAQAALSISGAEYLDHRQGRSTGETVVRYRHEGRRLECVVNTRTLRVIDSGICLTSGGVSGDTRFTLESLPAVVSEAINTNRLVVYRHG